MDFPRTPIHGIEVSAYTIPTDAPEADGTLAWDSTTLILVQIDAGSVRGLGYTYGNKATATVAKRLAERCLLGKPACHVPQLHESMLRQVRNDGSDGISSMAISALDIGLWDVKARLVGSPLSALFGRAESSVAAYGSGGFTSYSDTQLTTQFAQWVESGLTRVKMKVGSDPDADPGRVHTARKAIGAKTSLFVDANGAYGVKQAIALSRRFAEEEVSWFEEPVSSDHLSGLHRIRAEAPAGMEIAAGEYGYSLFYFRRMLEAGAVDVLQLDATRCKGYTGFLKAAAIAESFGCPLSAHCAPSLHMHAACAVPGFRHIEYFHDHARIEQMFFDGFIAPRNGMLQPDMSAPGLGLVFKQKDAERFAVS